MCSSDTKVPSSDHDSPPPSVDGRPVLQPTCNRPVNNVNPALRRNSSLKKNNTTSIAPRTPPPPPPPLPSSSARANTNIKVKANAIPTSPKLRSPRPPGIKRLGSENNGLTSSTDKLIIPRSTTSTTSTRPPTLERKKSKKSLIGGGGGTDHHQNGKTNNNNNNTDHPRRSFSTEELSSSSSMKMRYSSSLITEAPGSIAAVRREQIALQHAQRKMKIAHYGRSKSAKFDQTSTVVMDRYERSNSAKFNFECSKVAPLDESLSTGVEEKRCSFITPNSDPLYVAYHDEEWGVPVHDDKMLFELLILSGAQVGSDWASILKKRPNFREAFTGFDAEIVGGFTEKQINSVSGDYGIELSKVRGIVDNANRILEIKKEFGSFDKYIWGFLNYKPTSPQHKFSHKIPVKTSKSESISKDMVRRGFRYTGPTVIYSFMQAAGLTNDHLISCYRHLECTALSRASSKN